MTEIHELRSSFIGKVPQATACKSHSMTIFALCLPVFLALLLCPVAYADFASAPATGAAIVTNGKFTNLYLFHQNVPGETWDQHLAALGRTETRSAIDGFVGSLTASSYFFPLTQYGIFPPTFIGGAPTVASCVEAALKDRVKGAIQWNTLRSFAACQQSKDGMPSDQVNILISPDLNVAGPNFGPDSSPALCMPGASISAYHAWGLGVPNFSVIPLNKFCNANLSAVAESISHEMVEILSDPAGFGYIHETGPIGRTWPGDFIPDLGSGELGDICENGGPKNPGKDENIATMPFGPFRVSRYWSNVDNSCQPEFIMNRTWFTATGSPLVRFTGSVHDFSRPVAAPPADASAVIQQLMVLITTGGDNLNGGNGPNDNADAIITLKEGGRTITAHNINAGRGWGNNEFHTANLNLPPGIRGADIASLTIHTNFNGDNWNVNRLVLMAAVTPGPPPTPTPATATFNAIQITVATGHDNARSDTEIQASIPGLPSICLKPSNNANPNSTCNNNGHAADQNGNQEWKEWTSSKQQFSLPSPQARSAFSSLTIRLITHNNGTEGDDNWDIQGVSVMILPTNPSAPAVTLLTVGNLDNVHRGSKVCIRRLNGHGSTTFSLTGPNSTGPCNE